MAKQQPDMVYKGTLYGHTGWVTQMATCPQFSDRLVSVSRGNFKIKEMHS
jgi:hypothetical protein